MTSKCASLLLVVLAGCANHKCEGTELRDPMHERSSHEAAEPATKPSNLEYLSRVENPRENSQLFESIAMSGGDAPPLKVEGYGLSFVRGDETLSPDTLNLRVGAIEAGYAYRDDGRRTYHSVDYCIFISVPDRCLLAQESGIVCAGHWERNSIWVSDDAEKHDFNRDRISAREVADRGVTRAPLVATMKNLMRCDPVGEANASAYQKIVSEHVIEASGEEIELIKSSLKE